MSMKLPRINKVILLVPRIKKRSQSSRSNDHDGMYVENLEEDSDVTVEMTEEELFEYERVVETVEDDDEGDKTVAETVEDDVEADDEVV
jgi:hypothetical protein